MTYEKQEGEKQGQRERETDCRKQKNKAKRVIAPRSRPASACPFG